MIHALLLRPPFLQLAQIFAVAERVEARRFAVHAAPRIEAAAAAAATLDAACGEVAQSDLLRSVLKTALLAGAVQAHRCTC